MKKAKTYGLTHIAISVQYLDRTLTFYQKVFDVDVMYHQAHFLQVTTLVPMILLYSKREKPIPIAIGMEARVALLTLVSG